MFSKTATILLIGVIFQVIHICTSLSLPVPKRVTATLYYESRCPFCHKFINEQLFPTFNIMSDYMKVKLVPYGNAHRNFTDGHWQFTCQHGKLECDENVVDACAVQLLEDKDTSKLLTFVYCMSKNKDTPLNDRTTLCTKEAQIPLEKIISCVNSPEAEQLMLSMAIKTESLQPKLAGVPTVQIDGVYDPKERDDISSHLKEVICKHLGDPQPKICKEV